MTNVTIEKWGLHTVVDLINCNNDIITNAGEIEGWIINLVEILNMEAYGAPTIVRFGKDDKAGYSAVQLISTSNICAHFCETTNSAYIDIFSCKDYDPDEAAQFTAEYFEGTVASKVVLQR